MFSSDKLSYAERQSRTEAAVDALRRGRYNTLGARALHCCRATKHTLQYPKTSEYLDIFNYNSIYYSEREIYQKIKVYKGEWLRNNCLVGRTLMFKRVISRCEVTIRYITVLS
jgi:hypothetical protein